jgi:hypothetical protein
MPGEAKPVKKRGRRPKIKGAAVMPGGGDGGDTTAHMHPADESRPKKKAPRPFIYLFILSL